MLRYILLSLALLVCAHGTPAVSTQAATPAPAASRPDFVVPDQKIAGAEEPFDYGELGYLSVTPAGAKPDNYLGASYKWRLYEPVQDGGLFRLVEKRYQEGPNGIFFGTGIQPKRLTAMCIATHLFAVKEAGVIKQVAAETVILTADIVIGRGPAPPGPGPGPGPNPPPSPDLPDGKYKLAKFVFDTATAKVAKDANRARVAALMVETYRGVASAAAAGTIATATELLNKTRDANLAALAKAGLDRAAWAAFDRTLQDQLFELHSAGKLSQVPDYVAAWREIADGFAAVK